LSVKKYILFDHDGVLVDTEFWYYKAGERALADVGLALDKDQYLWDMNRGLGTACLSECLRVACPMLAGKPHEAVSNGGPRWMAAGPRERVHRTRPTGQLARRLTCGYAPCA
jgi:phosphoglycolate phosphatase-like HAD superfamily hydrolase